MFVHPLVVTCALIAPNFLFVAMTPETGLWAGPNMGSALAVVSFVSAAAQLAWIWSAYQFALAHAKQPGAEYSWGPPLFAAVTLVLAAVFLLSWVAPAQVFEFQQRADQSWPEMIVIDIVVIFGAVGFLLCHWLATKALLAAELPAPRAYSGIGTFLFMFYLFLGVWLLRPRLMALR
ncbi:MAG: hypothetical protein H7124_14285 [Phycisphaerales bacterium]|nr:hypothetical protein [Hyphomonadaceae bacterium]